MRHLFALVMGTALIATATACSAPSTPTATTVTVTSTVPAATSAPPFSPSPTASAPAAYSACADLGGTVDASRVCQIHTATGQYTIDVTFPVDYPDQRAVTDLVDTQRNQFVAEVGGQPSRGLPLALDLKGTTYRSGAAASGTESLVFEEYLNTGGAHPETYYEALNYDLGKSAPITLGTLFAPGTDVVAVLDPIVRQELQKRLDGTPVDDNPIGTKMYENFALTDDAVIFFIGQGMWTIEAAGPQQIPVPRSQLADVLC